MAGGCIPGVRIAGTGSFLPGAPISNEELCSRNDVPVTPGWIEEWTGIITRHMAGEHDTAASMATEAARRALDAAGMTGADLDRIILAGALRGDRPLPATANLVQAALAAPADAMDVGNGCTSFLTALDLGARCVATGTGPVLVVAAECGHGFRCPSDRRTFPLFGEGAAGVILVPTGTDRGGVLASRLLNDGTYWRYLWAPGPSDPERLDGPPVRFGVHGRRIKEAVPGKLASVVGPVLTALGMTPDSFDRVVPHQPNEVWVGELLRALAVDPTRVDLFVRETGSIPSVMIPLGLDRAWRSPAPPQPGHRLLMFAIGAGMSVGATAWEVA
jgi:3-oxoacyl-[acyl-carrier-protein] synthase-3